MYEKYSVLMSVYYKENPRYLQESIDSMLNQTIKPDQIVMVKDGPLTNELEEVLNKYEMEFPNIFECVTLEENKGLGVALNIGLKRCRNNLVARMDTDDISKPYRCERQLNEFKMNKKLGIVGCTVEEFIEDKNKIVSKRVLPEEHNEICKFATRRNPFNHPTVMFKKELIKAVGGYKELHFFEDYFLWIRMLHKGIESKNIQEGLLLMRVNNELYSRRGGMNYFINSIRLRIIMYRMKFSSCKDLLIGVVGHGIVCLLPNRIRKKIYINLLRK